MKIFSSLVYYDAKWVPTGKEGIEMVCGTIIKSQYGKSLKCVREEDEVFCLPLSSDLDVPLDTQTKGFKWIELGMIGRRSDNEFHDEDVKNSTEKILRVSELIF